MSDVIKKYQESSYNCKCLSWARADYQSGFLSVHHSGCDKFNPINEIHILSVKLSSVYGMKLKISQLEEKVKKLEAILPEVKCVIEVSREDAKLMQDELKFDEDDDGSYGDWLTRLYFLEERIKEIGEMK